MTEEHHDDIAVVGAGMAGLVAALRLAEAGHDVTVLERADHVGGSMALSAGLVWAYKDFETSRALMPLGDPELQSLQVRNTLRDVEWLETHGLPFGPVQDCLPNDVGVGRAFGLGTAGDRKPFADRLADAVREAGGRILLGVGPVDVERDDRWSLRSRDGAVHVAADGLIVATGGFQSSPELVERYISREAASLCIRSNRMSDGFAIGLAAQLGYGLSRGMSSFYGHTVPHLAAADALAPDDYIPATQYYSNHAVAVNAYGLRFADESASLIDEGLAEGGSRQPGARYYLIFDSRVMTDVIETAQGLPGVNRSRGNNFTYARQLGAWIAQADTLPELCERLVARGVPKETAADTLREYNETQDPVYELEPPRRRGHRRLDQPPYVAVECRAAITATNGGLRVDERMRVSSSVTGGPPLYAAGADAGGVFKGAYGGGLSWALVSGVAAADSVRADLAPTSEAVE